MRPFKIPLTNRWVDLDTIQEIREPALLDHTGCGGYYIELTWQHAFRDDLSSKCFEQPIDWNSTGQSFQKDSEGNPSELSRIHSEVFVPLFNAWRNR